MRKITFVFVINEFLGILDNDLDIALDGGNYLYCLKENISEIGWKALYMFCNIPPPFLPIKGSKSHKKLFAEMYKY